MAVKYPVIKNGMYYGKIEDNRAEMILSVRQQKCVDALKHFIFDFPPELVLRSLNEGRSIRSIIKEENIDYTQYIGELRDYQTVGAAFMYLSPRSILGDGVGLGKTAEIAALINYLKQNNELTRFLIAVETSALGQTQCELIRFTGLHIVQIPSEKPKMLKVLQNTDWGKVDGMIIKHSGLRSDLFSSWLAMNLNSAGMCNIFNTFILDESSVIKNMDTKIYRYTENICNIVPRVHFMNATTFETCIMDIYNQIDMMDKTLLPKKWRIEKEFCTFSSKLYWTRDKQGKPQKNYSWQLSGYKNQAKFKESLKLVYFGRSKQDVGMQRPHIHKVYEVEPTLEQTLAINKGYRYMEVLNCPSLIDGINIPFDRKNVPKLDRLVQLVENEFADDKIMVYCFHLDAQQVIADELRKIGRNPVILNGADDDETRWQKMTEFNKGQYDVIITNIMKSLNLYGGDVCIFYTVLSNPSKIFQVAGRVDRNVDNKIKTFILLLYKYTDEYRFFMEVVKQRAKDARDLTIDAKTTVDYFIEYMMGQEDKKDNA